MNSKQFCSFDNFNSLLWGYYSFGILLLLALKLTIIIIERGDMVGGGSKSFANLIVVTKLNIMKGLKCLHLKFFVMLF